MKFGFLFLLSVLIIVIWVNIHYALVRRCTKCSQELKEPTAEWRSEVSLTLITWKWIKPFSELKRTLHVTYPMPSL